MQNPRSAQHPGSPTMPDELRQRRGSKKSSGTSTAATSASSTSADDAALSKDNQPTPIEQLRRARARLVISRERMLDLHAAWKRQLFMMSLVIVAVTLYQLQTSMSTCIHEIKDSNNGVEDQESAVTTGVAAMKLVFSNSFSEIVGVFVASLLACFLALGLVDPHRPMALEQWPYLASSALVPLCLSFYFHTKQRGCAAGDAHDAAADAPAAADIRHQFPVVVIYHTIVTVAAWFMKGGMQKAEEHVDLVSDSIRDFERMDKKLALKRQLKSKARAK